MYVVKNETIQGKGVGIKKYMTKYKQEREGEREKGGRK